jgi:hypothetical protein
MKRALRPKQVSAIEAITATLTNYNEFKGTHRLPRTFTWAAKRLAEQCPVSASKQCMNINEEQIELLEKALTEQARAAYLNRINRSVQARARAAARKPELA